MQSLGWTGYSTTSRHRDKVTDGQMQGENIIPYSNTVSHLAGTTDTELLIRILTIKDKRITSHLLKHLVGMMNFALLYSSQLSLQHWKP